MKTLEELFEHQLKDLHSAETQLTEALPTMAKKTNDSKLQQAFESHLEGPREHKRRVEAMCKELDNAPNGEKCKAMEGLIREAKDFISEADTDEVMDAGLIAEAQRVEHYEIAGYGTL